MNVGGRIIAVLVVVLAVLPCAAFGVCSAFAGVATLPDISRGGGPSVAFMLVLVAFSIASVIGLLYAVRSLWKG